MIRLKDILLESDDLPSVFVPRRTEDRLDKMLQQYVRGGCKGNLDLSNMNLSKIPAILKDKTIDGSFYITFNKKIDSLENCPAKVTETFSCSGLSISNFVGGPEYVGKFFMSHYCHNLNSFIGSPKYVGGDFFINGNNVFDSINGLPETIGGNCVIHVNYLGFTEKDIRKVCDVKGKVKIVSKFVI